MEIEENKDYMLIKNAENFNIKDTLYSGQMFRFQAKNKGFIVQSGSEVAEIEQLDAKNIKISSKNLKYFKNFFDFDTDYDIILKNLEKFDYLKDALNFSRGIRILKQQPLETLICFIISANNANALALHLKMVCLPSLHLRNFQKQAFKTFLMQELAFVRNILKAQLTNFLMVLIWTKSNFCQQKRQRKN